MPERKNRKISLSKETLLTIEARELTTHDTARASVEDCTCASSCIDSQLVC